MDMRIHTHGAASAARVVCVHMQAETPLKALLFAARRKTDVVLSNLDPDGTLAV